MSNVNRLPVTLTAAGERAVRAGHPWIFDGAIQKIKGEGRAGDLAIIFSYKKNKCIGVGLYDPGSPIRIRVLNGGGPAKINTEFFTLRFVEAYAKRASLLATDTTGYRLLHGENDGLPGLVVDIYGTVAVLKLYTAAWFPWLDTLRPLILETTGANTLVLRLARNIQGEGVDVAQNNFGADAGAGLVDGAVLDGHLESEELTFKEHGLSFYANVVKGHKTGFFLDHRANRKRIGELSKNKEVLDVFSYAGGFSVHALGGGAGRVTSLDISKPALEQARRNVALNFGADTAHQTLAGDAFEALAELARKGTTYDIVIVDPPSFAGRDAEVPGALNAYRKINQLAVPW